ncbi:MAG: DUF3341 domain-containing protein [Polyangiaceae bacterium]
MSHDHEHDEEEESSDTHERGELYGLMGFFEKPAALYHACEEVRDAGYKAFDAQTPFPVHGLEKAMGLKPTRLPFFVLAGGATGLATAVALTYYCNWDYPLNISGKLPFSYQIYIPIYFELTILFSALTCFFGLWVISKLPTFFHPTMTHKSFTRTTDDAFFLCIEAKDPKFDAQKTRAFLEKLGAQQVEELYS